jgi:hypothetical protein
MPDNVTVDCNTGAVTCIPLTAEEMAARQAAADAEVAEQQAADDARQQLMDAVAASTDPAVPALAQLTGVIQ